MSPRQVSGLGSLVRAPTPSPPSAGACAAVPRRRQDGGFPYNGSAGRLAPPPGSLHPPQGRNKWRPSRMGSRHLGGAVARERYPPVEGGGTGGDGTPPLPHLARKHVSGLSKSQGSGKAGSRLIRRGFSGLDQVRALGCRLDIPTPTPYYLIPI